MNKFLAAVGVFFAIVASLVIAAVFVFTIGPNRNDAAAQRMLDQWLEGLDLPTGATVVETATACGNTGGTGNHNEIWAGILVYAETPITYAYRAREDGPQTRIMSLLGVRFEALQDLSDQACYYILETYESAPVQYLDLRGH